MKAHGYLILRVLDYFDFIASLTFLRARVGQLRVPVIYLFLFRSHMLLQMLSHCTGEQQSSELLK